MALCNCAGDLRLGKRGVRYVGVVPQFFVRVNSIFGRVNKVFGYLACGVIED